MSQLPCIMSLIWVYHYMPLVFSYFATSPLEGFVISQFSPPSPDLHLRLPTVGQDVRLDNRIIDLRTVWAWRGVAKRGGTEWCWWMKKMKKKTKKKMMMMFGRSVGWLVGWLVGWFGMVLLTDEMLESGSDLWFAYPSRDGWQLRQVANQAIFRLQCGTQVPIWIRKAKGWWWFSMVSLENFQFYLETKSSKILHKILRVCVGLRSGVCMLFREFLLQNDFQVPLTWGKGGGLEIMGVRGLPQHNLKFRFRFAKRVVSSSCS